MTNNEYQLWVQSRSTPRVNELGLVYASLGLAGETGEVIERVKKIVRDNREPGPFDREYLRLELGDVLWYIAKMCNILGLTLDEIMEANVEKINYRKEHNEKQFSSD